MSVALTLMAGSASESVKAGFGLGDDKRRITHKLGVEPQHVLDSYGPDVTRQGTYAFNCLIARRLAERGVRARVQCRRARGAT